MFETIFSTKPVYYFPTYFAPPDISVCRWSFRIHGTQNWNKSENGALHHPSDICFFNIIPFLPGKICSDQDPDIL